MVRSGSALLVIDVQTRLMPAIEGADAVVANVRRLLDAAALLDVPVAFTEQNPAGLGPTVDALQPARPVQHKMAFDACRDGGLAAMPNRPAMIVAGCEAHVCVLQTVLGLLAAGRQVFVVRDALGSRRAESKETAIARMARHGADIVTTEMVIFEWLQTAADPNFKQAVALVK
jgi:nicotinamidase-related amidase